MLEKHWLPTNKKDQHDLHTGLSLRFSVADLSGKVHVAAQFNRQILLHVHICYV